MEGKLKVDTVNLPKIRTAADLLDVQITNEKAFGTKTVLEVKFRQPSQLFELGECYQSVTASNQIASEKQVVPSKK